MDIFYKRNAELIESLSKFGDAEAFNLHMRRVYLTFNDELGGNLKEFVKFLSRYSIKCGGVSWQKVETMAAGFGRSKRTIKRYIKELTWLGIIERVKPIKGSHYITYFADKIELLELPTDTPDVTPQMSHLENGETPTAETDKGGYIGQESMSFKAVSESKDLSNKRNKGGVTIENDTVINTPKKLDNSFIPKWVAADFVEAAKPFFADANAITKLWTKATNAARDLELCGKNEGADSYTDIAIDAFKTTIYDHKRRAIKGSIYNYFFGVVRNMLNDYKTDIAEVSYTMPQGSVYYNWLNA